MQAAVIVASVSANDEPSGAGIAVAVIIMLALAYFIYKEWRGGGK